jgi:hypothetical protein
VSTSFAPGLSRYAAAGGRVTRRPYAPGAGGHKQSLDLIAQKMCEGRLDPAVQQWARQALIAARLDGRDHPTVKELAQCLTEALRATVIYVPDATSAEVVASASATLCLGPGLCMNAGDCDDQVVALGSALLSIGLTVAVVKEDYPTLDAQSHVLLAVRDERGEWLYCDPSTRYPVSAQSMSPLDTVRSWVNPLEGVPVEIVSLGRHPFGAPPPAPTIPGNWTDVPNNVVHAGLRYAVAIVSNPNWTDEDVKAFFAPDWFVELIDQRTELESIRAWIMIGLARRDLQLANTPDVSVSAVLQEQVAPSTGPAPSPGPPPQLPPPPPVNGTSTGTILLFTLGTALAGGVAYGLYERSKKRRRA